MPVPVVSASVVGSLETPRPTRGGGVKTPELTSQFEQLLVRQLLTQVRASSFSESGDGPLAASGYQAIADDHLAKLIASVGGLGLGAALAQTLADPKALPPGVGRPGLTNLPATAVNPLTDQLFKY